MADKEQQFGTVIGADASFKGDFSFDSAARVLGNIEGSIKSKGVIHVASGSRCKATISAKEVAVEGIIEGNVEATDRVELKPDGRIHGDVVASKMTMADGASIDGYCRIGTNGKAPAATELKPSSASASGDMPGKAQPAKAR